MANVFEPNENHPAPPPPESAGVPNDLPQTPEPYPHTPAQPEETLGENPSQEPVEPASPIPAAEEPTMATSQASEWEPENPQAGQSEPVTQNEGQTQEQAPGSAPEQSQAAYSPPPGYAGQPVQQPPLSPQDERTWAMLAHLSVLLNLVTGFLGPLAAFIIYLVYKDRSRYVAFQALQATLFQLIWWVGAGAVIGLMWAVTGLLSIIIIGLLLIPIALILTLVLGVVPIAALVYGVVGGIETSQGHDFRYWLIGDWTLQLMGAR